MFVVLRKSCSVFTPKFRTMFTKKSLKIFETSFSSLTNLSFSSSVIFSTDFSSTYACSQYNVKIVLYSAKVSLKIATISKTSKAKRYKAAVRKGNCSYLFLAAENPKITSSIEFFPYANAPWKFENIY